jgi:hypothetical protein
VAHADHGGHKFKACMPFTKSLCNFLNVLHTSSEAVRTL